MISKQYWVGLFDGEGCVYIRRDTREIHKYQPEITVRLSLGNTNFQVIKMLRMVYGGSITPKWKNGVPKGKKWHQSWTWCGCAKIAMKFMKDIYPFTIIKKDELKLAIEMQELLGVPRQYQKGRLGAFVSKKIVRERERKYREYKCFVNQQKL